MWKKQNDPSRFQNLPEAQVLESFPVPPTNVGDVRFTIGAGEGSSDGSAAELPAAIADAKALAGSQTSPAKAERSSTSTGKSKNASPPRSGTRAPRE